MKVFLNDSCYIALFSLYTSLSGRIHILSKRYSPWEQTCWLLSTDCTKENEFWHPLCKLLLSSQERAKSFFCTFFNFFCSDDHISLFTRSQYMPILIVYRVIKFSKEGNWFYKRFQQIFQKWRKYYFLSIFQILHTGATLGPEINSLCRQQGCFHVLFVSGCLDWSGVRSWKIDKIILILR